MSSWHAKHLSRKRFDFQIVKKTFLCKISARHAISLTSETAFSIIYQSILNTVDQVVSKKLSLCKRKARMQKKNANGIKYWWWTSINKYRYSILLRKWQMSFCTTMKLAPNFFHSNSHRTRINSPNETQEKEKSLAGFFL